MHPAGHEKLIRKVEASTASDHDSKHFDAVLDPFNTNRDVYAEWGSPSKARSEFLEQEEYQDQIQRCGTGKPLITDATRSQPSHR